MQRKKYFFFFFLFQETINETLDNAMLHNINAKGVILEGYPRDLKQLHEFEEKVIIINISYIRKNYRNGCHHRSIFFICISMAFIIRHKYFFFY